MRFGGVTPTKQNELMRRLAALGIVEDDLEEKFVRASGPGGQKINNTSIAVSLKHLPSGMVVHCREARSQTLNRYRARIKLVEALETREQGRLSAEQQRIAKVRRQKRKRSKRAKEKTLEHKHKTGEKKARRKRIDPGAE